VTLAIFLSEDPPKPMGGIIIFPPGPQIRETVFFLSSIVWPGQSDIHEKDGGVIIFHLQNYLTSGSFADANSIAKFKN